MSNSMTEMKTRQTSQQSITGNNITERIQVKTQNAQLKRNQQFGFGVKPRLEIKLTLAKSLYANVDEQPPHERR